MYFVIPVPFSFFCVFVFFFCSHWSLVDVPLIFFCPADHVPDWQPRVLLGMVEARSVNNVKKITTTVQNASVLKTAGSDRTPKDQGFAGSFGIIPRKKGRKPVDFDKSFVNISYS